MVTRKLGIFICFAVGLAAAILMGIPALLATPQVDFLGQATLGTGTLFKNTEVGGLSGITYDPEKQVYYAISDDRSSKAPARFYTLKIDLHQDSLKSEGVSILAVTTLLNETGQPFAELSLDSEAIAFTGNSIFVASEGDVNRNILPFVAEFSLEGKFIRTLPIPEKFLPAAAGNRGIRNNFAFESLALTPDKQYLFTATENALVQDGEAATVSNGTPCRILRYNLRTGQPDQEFLYWAEPVAAAPNSPDGLNTNGLVDLIALNEQKLISLERSFSMGVGNDIKLFYVSLETASDIHNFDSIKDKSTEILSAQKGLILDLKTLNILLDNLEGLTFGQSLENGKSSLILVSDNNFHWLQMTQFLAFRYQD